MAIRARIGAGRGDLPGTHRPHRELIIVRSREQVSLGYIAGNLKIIRIQLVYPMYRTNMNAGTMAMTRSIARLFIVSTNVSRSA